MAYGIQCYNASGVLTMSLESRLLRYMGIFTFPVVAQNGYFDGPAFSGMVNDGTWVAFTTDGNTVATIMNGWVRVLNAYMFATPSGGNCIVMRC